jgi:hypothetical protein
MRIIIVIIVWSFCAIAIAGEKEITHESMYEGGIISIWVSAIKNEDQLDDYLSYEFHNEFGFEIDPRNGPEVNYSSEQPVEIEILLRELSWGEHFSDSVSEMIPQRINNKTSSVMVFYNFKYNKSLINRSIERKMKYIGSYPYKGK